jgi:hypothetical protein
LPKGLHYCHSDRSASIFLDEVLFTFNWIQPNERRFSVGFLTASPWLLRTCSILVVLLLFWDGASPGFFSQEATTPQIKIIVLEGDGAINNIRQRTTREPIVQVEDENHKPVAGALVVFTLPDSGAGGVFSNGSSTSMVYTDQKGQAVARGIQANKIAGQFQIKISASFKGMTATNTISQTNAAAAAAAAAGGISAKVIAIIAVAGAAAATGAVLATRQKQQPTTVSIGTPSVGRP